MLTKCNVRGINIQKYSNVFSEERVFSNVGCLSFSGFDEISKAVFEIGASLTEKQNRKEKGCGMYTHLCYAYWIVSYWLARSSCFWKSKWRERGREKGRERERERECFLCKSKYERVCTFSVNQNVKERESESVCVCVCAVSVSQNVKERERVCVCCLCKSKCERERESVCVCAVSVSQNVKERERERERECVCYLCKSKCERERECVCVCVCVCVCAVSVSQNVCERERERERECVCCLCKSKCVREKCERMSSWKTRVYIGNPCHVVGSKCAEQKSKMRT